MHRPKARDRIIIEYLVKANLRKLREQLLLHVEYGCELNESSAGLPEVRLSRTSSLASPSTVKTLKNTNRHPQEFQVLLGNFTRALWQGPDRSLFKLEHTLIKALQKLLGIRHVISVVEVYS